MPHFVLKLENYGPFSSLDLVVKPLTIIIGRNSLGKSMLLYLLWGLGNIYHGEIDLRKIYGEDAYIEKINRISRYIIDGGLSEKGIRDLLIEFMFEAVKSFDKLVTMNLGEVLAKTYGINSLDDLVKRGEREATISLRGPYGELEITIRNGKAEASWIDVAIEEALADIADNMVEYDKDKRRLKINIGDNKLLAMSVQNYEDVRLFVAEKVVPAVIEHIIGFSHFHEDKVILVDGRAGIMRALNRLYSILTEQQLAFLSMVDREFLRKTRSLFEDYFVGEYDVETDLLKDIYREFGILDIVPRYEAGIRKIYVKLWTGIYQSLEESPAGIREILPLVISLISTRLKNIYVEEPEAHLHPGAIWALSKIIGYAVSQRKTNVYMTTHSDYLVYCINILIQAHRVVGRKHIQEELDKINIDPRVVIDPDTVSAYLLHRENDNVVADNLVIGEEGIDEKHFSDIITELAVRREYIDAIAR